MAFVELFEWVTVCTYSYMLSLLLLFEPMIAQKLHIYHYQYIHTPLPSLRPSSFLPLQPTSHYFTVVPDAGKIPAPTNEGTSNDNHGPNPNANACASPNVGTFLAHNG